MSADKRGLDPTSPQAQHQTEIRILPDPPHRFSLRPGPPQSYQPYNALVLDSDAEGDTASMSDATKKKKKKVLLMGKSGSGKSSMRSIIFSNYVAKDVRRLGATIDVEHSHAKFMGNLTLNLWDCGGQDAFMDSYLNAQRPTIFSDTAVLIYVFDIESRSVESDLDTFHAIIQALRQYSPSAHVFVLIHKMDLVQSEKRDAIYNERVNLIISRSEGMSLETFASSIWDQTLYKAWAGIVHRMIPDLARIESFLSRFASFIKAEEITLIERSTFLTVTSVSTVSAADAALFPVDRHERLSNITKSYRHAIARSTRTTPASAGFILFKIQTPRFNSFMSRFTENTYIFVVTPPGEIQFNVAVLNTALVRQQFAAMGMDGPIQT